MDRRSDNCRATLSIFSIFATSGRSQGGWDGGMLKSRWRPLMFTGWTLGREDEEGRKLDRRVVVVSRFHREDGFYRCLWSRRVHIFSAGAQRLTGWERLRLCLSCRRRLQRCDAPIFGTTAEAFCLKPDIMQETRLSGRIKGEQSTGLENVLRPGRSVHACATQYRIKLQPNPPDLSSCNDCCCAPKQSAISLLSFLEF